jgi:hypothetical protein
MKALYNRRSSQAARKTQKEQEKRVVEKIGELKPEIDQNGACM